MYSETHYENSDHTRVGGTYEKGGHFSGVDKTLHPEQWATIHSLGVPTDWIDPTPPPTYIDKRRPEYREKLATLKGEPGMDEVGVIGFQLDAMFAQLVTLAGGVENMTPEMQAIITTVQGVKAKFPKP